MSWQRKPILLGGLALSGGLWLWWQLQAAAAEVGELGVWLAIAAGGGLWWLQRRGQPVAPRPVSNAAVTRAEAEQAIAQARARLELLATEAPQCDRAALEQALKSLPAQLDRLADRWAIAGGRKVGKTSLLQALQSADWAAGLHWQEIPDSLHPAREALSQENRAEASLNPALQADALLFAIAGDLTDSELRALQRLRQARARVLVVVNKLDQYAPDEQIEVLQQVRDRLAGWLPATDIVAAAAAPAPLKVRQQQADGTLCEQWEPRSPDLAALNERLATLWATERQTLAWATAWRAARQVESEIDQALQAVRRERALPIVERYQWLAAATAFANPVAALDLLTTAAIGAQMIVDLGAVYQQKVSLAQAQAIASTLGALVAKLGLVELSTQAIAGALKTNLLSYAAGGAVQGLSAAYLTRLAGLSAIEAFQSGDPAATLAPTRLETILQTVFQNHQRAAVWQSFLQAGLARLKGLPATG